MPAEVKILIEGLTNADSVAEMGEERTQPTITLVQDGDLVMVVDPGILENQQVLIDALEKENLTVDQVNVVCITHSHLDHYRNVGMFPEAKVLEYFGLWHENTVEPWQEQFSTNIQILRTPGHDNTDITLFVTTGPESGYPGVVAICGDVFWKENYPQDPHDDTFASDPVRLEQSRQLVLRMADWIIPGHGNIYKVKKEQLHADKVAQTSAKSKQPQTTAACKKCGRPMKQGDRCQCRPWLCFRCCECGLDCDLCSCSHKW